MQPQVPNFSCRSVRSSRGLALVLLSLCGFFSLVDDAASQMRDLRAERLVIDDDGADGTRNIMTIQTGDSLSRNVVVIIPDMGSDSAELMLLPYGSAGAWLLGGNAGTVPGTSYLGTSDATALHLYVNGGASNALILNTDGSIQKDTGGDTRGANAIDFQSARTATDQVAGGDYAVIAGGLSNLASGTKSVVGGGEENQALGTLSTVSGGDFNDIGNGSTGAVIGGGNSNVIRSNASFSIIGGGQDNNIWDNQSWATIAGGQQNSVQDNYTTVGGGLGNVMESGTYASVIAGGDYNRLYADAGYSSIGGGSHNSISAEDFSTISGGQWNEIEADEVTIGGGSHNTVETGAGHAVIGGGTSNTIGSGSWQATIGGGSNSIGSDSWVATIAGGSGNAISDSSRWSVIGGGLDNTIEVEDATISGGSHNTVETGAGHAVIGGGTSNTIGSGSWQATIGGGSNSIGSDSWVATIAGGYGNAIDSFSNGSVIAGGSNNSINGQLSVIAGGRGLTLNGAGSFGFLGNNNNGNRDMEITAHNTSVLGNTDLWLANNNGAASRLRFYEANSTTGAFPTGTTYYTSFEAGNQSEDISYTLPSAAPTSNGQVLSSDTNGVMSWSDGPTGAQSFANAGSTTPTLALENDVGTDDGTALEIVEGRVVLSNGQGAPTNIPDDVVAFEINDVTASSIPTVGLPVSGTNGQILYLLVSDPDGATVGGTARASGDKLTYLYLGGAWQLFHLN